MPHPAVKAHQRAPRSSRTSALALMALVLTMVLTACGVKIDTSLEVERSGAGQRVMTLTLPASDFEHLVGGLEAADASIRRHLPEEAEFSGFTTDDEGAAVSTVTISFDSPRDYLRKAQAILAAGDVTWDPASEFTVEDSRFVKGIDVNEAFSSVDLLTWMFDGLVADGVLAEDRSSNAWEYGDTTVTYDGVTYESLRPIRLTEVSDNGFTEVTMQTTVDDSGLTRKIEYFLADKATHRANSELYDEFFTELEEAGFTVATSDQQVGTVWNATVHTDSPEELVRATNAALLSEDSVFTVTQTGAENRPLRTVTSLSDHTTCTAVCALEAEPVRDYLRIPGGGELLSNQQVVGGLIEVAMAEGPIPVRLAYTHPLGSVATTLEAADNGSYTWQARLEVPASTQAAVGEALTEFLEPADGVGQLAVEAGGDDADATYVVTVAGDDAETFAANFIAWSGDDSAYVDRVNLPGANFTRSKFQLSGHLPLPVRLREYVTEAPTMTVHLTSGGAFSTEVPPQPTTATVEGADLSFAGDTFSAEAGGITVAGIVLYVVLGLLVLAVIVVVVLLRRWILAQLRRAHGAYSARRERAVAARAAAAPDSSANGAETDHWVDPDLGTSPASPLPTASSATTGSAPGSPGPSTQPGGRVTGATKVVSDVAAPAAAAGNGATPTVPERPNEADFL